MAIGRITGQMLSANLARSGTDLAFETNLLALDVTNSRIGIGTASPATTLHVSATDALRLPSGTTGQRPGSPANGDIRYNTTTSTIEGYSNGAYANLASGSELKDADEDTSINVEHTSDVDEIHFNTANNEVAIMRTASTDLGVTNISNTASTITGLVTNGNITLTPNGSGVVAVSSALTVAGAATITGNLTVNGTTTTVDSTTLTIEDPLLTLAKNNSGGAANTFDQGLFFNRGSDANVSFLWDESADQFAFAVTSGEDGTTAGNVTIDSYADLRAKDITATDIDAILGSNTPAAATVTTLTASGAVELDGGNVTINESSASVDFRVESNGHAHALFVDGSEDHVGVKTASPSYDLDVSGSTDAIRVPVGSTGQRPTAATGIIRYNTTTGAYEGSTDGSTFVNFAIAGAAPTFTKESATGDGSTTTFSGFFSSAPESANNVFVYIDNVYQEPTENYTVSGTNITFTSAPHSAARIFAITGADGTSLVTGGIARSETSSVNFTSSATNILTFNGTTYRSAEIFICLTDTANSEYAAMKGVVVHNGTTAFITVHAITNTGSTDLATITANYNSGTVEVKATSTGGTTAAKVQYSLMTA
tara:strand:+ start:1149 stop:2939 length:1791 start_codon:yes stop_codon:yes gene_type:complete